MKQEYSLAKNMLIKYYGTNEYAIVEKLKLKHTLFSLSICPSCSSQTFPLKAGMEPLKFLAATQA